MNNTVNYLLATINLSYQIVFIIKYDINSQ